MLFLTENETGRKKAVVMVGRFNPPTIGHYHVIDKMKKYIRTNDQGVTTGVIVIVDGEETGKDKSKNPLTASERMAYMKASGYADIMHITTAPNGFEAFKVCRDEGYEPITIAAGSDRADRYLETLDKYFDKDEAGKPIKHFKIKGLDRESEEEVPEDGSINQKNVSGSMARHAASLGYFDEFAEITGLTHKPKLAKMLFDKVVKVMNSQKEEPQDEPV